MCLTGTAASAQHSEEEEEKKKRYGAKKTATININQQLQKTIWQGDEDVEHQPFFRQKYAHNPVRWTAPSWISPFISSVYSLL